MLSISLLAEVFFAILFPRADYSHTEIFMFILLSCCLYFTGAGKMHVCSLYRSHFFHIIEDRMWSEPQNLFLAPVWMEVPLMASGKDIGMIIHKYYSKSFTPVFSFDFISEAMIYFDNFPCSIRKKKEKIIF